MRSFLKSGFHPAGIILCELFVFSSLTFAGTYSGGSGTFTNPFMIRTVADWQELIATSADWDKCFVLMNDIDFGGMNLTPVAPDPIPDGLGNLLWGLFSGELDGNGHTLRNAIIDLPNKDYVGLFGAVSGWIHLLTLTDISVNGSQYVGGLCGYNFMGGIEYCSMTGTLSGKSFVGGICGYNKGGFLRSCSASIHISGGDSAHNLGGICGVSEVSIVDGYKMDAALQSCFTSGTISGRGVLGGLCGDNWGGILRGCSSSVTITGGDSAYYLGGLCGSNRSWTSYPYAGYPDCMIDAIIEYCFASGSVTGGSQSANVGGLCGENVWGCTACGQAVIRDSYATGSVKGSALVGGLCGSNQVGTIQRCFSTGRTQGERHFGGLVGFHANFACYWTEGEVGCEDTSDIKSSFWDMETSEMTTSRGGIGKTTAEMKTKATFAAAGWDFGVWQMCEESDPNDPQAYYPRLRWQVPKVDWVCPDGVAMEDFLYLAERWLATTPATMGQADTNGDGKVDIEDLAILSENWMR